MSVRVVAVVARIGAGDDRAVEISVVAADAQAAMTLVGARLPPGWEIRGITESPATDRPDR